MFYGEFHHSLNAKNQVTVPALFRSIIESGDEAGGLVLYSDNVECIYVYTKQEWEKVVERASIEEYASEEERDVFLRALYSSAQPCTVDGQGRMVIPAAFKNNAGIDKEVAIIGARKRLEIWDLTTWTDKTNVQKQGYEQAITKRKNSIFRV